MIATGNLQIQKPAFPTVDGLTCLNPDAISEQTFAVRDNNAEMTSTFVALYRADKPGTYQLGPIQVSMINEAGQTSNVTAEPVTVEVYEDAPRPPSDIIHSVMPSIWKYLLGIAIVALALGLFAWWLKYRNRQPEDVRATPASILLKTPEQNAVEEIRALARPLASDGDAVKAYYDKVDEILRKYVNRRYNISTSDATTWEIQQELRRRKRLDPRLKGVFGIINDCDWVKYAKCRPTQRQIDSVPVQAADVLTGGPDERADR